MGLDMYLSKRKYVKNWEHMKPEDRHTITIKKAGKTIVSKLPIKEVVYEAAYWRKANAIHNWFVQNVQDGEDDCRQYYVSGEQLQELVDLCKQVLKVAKTEQGKVVNGYSMSKDKNGDIVKTENLEDGVVVTNSEEVEALLPPTSGFFFGSTDIDGYFLDDIRSTVEQLELALSDEGSDGEYGADFTYQSSW